MPSDHVNISIRVIASSSHIHFVLPPDPAIYFTCFYEYNMAYNTAGNINSGDSQPDADSCRNFCLTTYHNAEYYTYITGSNACWCKGDMGTRTSTSDGRISGNVKCSRSVGITGK